MPLLNANFRLLIVLSLVQNKSKIKKEKWYGLNSLAATSAESAKAQAKR